MSDDTYNIRVLRIVIMFIAFAIILTISAKEAAPQLTNKTASLEQAKALLSAGNECYATWKNPPGSYSDEPMKVNKITSEYRMMYRIYTDNRWFHATQFKSVNCEV